MGKRSTVKHLYGRRVTTTTLIACRAAHNAFTTAAEGTLRVYRTAAAKFTTMLRRGLDVRKAPGTVKSFNAALGRPILSPPQRLAKP